MAKLILNKHFNHIEDGQIERYQQGEDVSHLPEEKKQWLVDNGHVDESDGADKPENKAAKKSKK